MPLRLDVGVSKKLGLPAYSSIGASCNLEVELDDGLLCDLGVNRPEELTLADASGLIDQLKAAATA